MARKAKKSRKNSARKREPREVMGFATTRARREEHPVIASLDRVITGAERLEQMLGKK